VTKNSATALFIDSTPFKPRMDRIAGTTVTSRRQNGQEMVE
jgi:hypothetical protein